MGDGGGGHGGGPVVGGLLLLQEVVGQLDLAGLWSPQLVPTPSWDGAVVGENKASTLVMAACTHRSIIEDISVGACPLNRATIGESLYLRDMDIPYYWAEVHEQSMSNKKRPI
jgi:hypothetical protein